MELLLTRSGHELRVSAAIVPEREQLYFNVRSQFAASCVSYGFARGAAQRLGSVVLLLLFLVDAAVFKKLPNRVEQREDNPAHGIPKL